MPPAIAAGISAIGGWIAANAVLVAMTVLSTGASLLQASSARKKMKRALAGMGLDQGRTEMIKDPLAPRRMIYGQCRVGGVITFFRQPTPTDNTGAPQQHYMVLTLAAHECHAIENIRIDNQEVTLDAQGIVTNGPYKNKIQIRKFLGKQSGERDLQWEGLGNNLGWSSSHLGRGIARLHVRLEWDAEVFLSGIPQITALVSGAKVYDPRSSSQSPTNPSTWAFSDNSALCAAHFLHTRKGVPYSRIDTGALITAANICDEPGGYKTNGCYIYDQPPLAALEELAETMAGDIIDTGGKWTIRAGGWVGPVMHLTDNDLRGPLRVNPVQPRSDFFNAVRGTYYSPQNDWAPADFPAVATHGLGSVDAHKNIWKDVAYPYIISSGQARKVANIDIQRARQALTIEADFHPRLLACTVGDVITITRPRLGWDKKLFEIREWTFKTIASEGGQGEAALAVGIVATETAPQIFGAGPKLPPREDPAPNIGLPDPRYVRPPTGVTLQLLDELTSPRVKVTWAASTDPLVLSGGHTDIQYKRKGETQWTHWASVPPNITQDVITDLEFGYYFTLQISHVNSVGVRSQWIEAGLMIKANDPILTSNYSSVNRASVSSTSDGHFTPSTITINSKRSLSGLPYVGRYRVSLLSHDGSKDYIGFSPPYHYEQVYFSPQNVSTQTIPLITTWPDKWAGTGPNGYPQNYHYGALAIELYPPDITSPVGYEPIATYIVWFNSTPEVPANPDKPFKLNGGSGSNDSIDGIYNYYYPEYVDNGISNNDIYYTGLGTDCAAGEAIPITTLPYYYMMADINGKPGVYKYTFSNWYVYEFITKNNAEIEDPYSVSTTVKIYKDTTVRPKYTPTLYIPLAGI